VYCVFFVFYSHSSDFTITQHYGYCPGYLWPVNFISREESWDFGEITPDELPTHIFKFENIGDEVLIIKETKVNCESCIAPVISTKELKPGEEGKLEITVNSLDMIGRFTKRTYVESNDPVNPRTVITVSGFIKGEKRVCQPDSVSN